MYKPNKIPILILVAFIMLISACAEQNIHSNPNAFNSTSVEELTSSLSERFTDIESIKIFKEDLIIHFEIELNTFVSDNNQNKLLDEFENYFHKIRLANKFSGIIKFTYLDSGKTYTWQTKYKDINFEDIVWHIEN